MKRSLLLSLLILLTCASAAKTPQQPSVEHFSKDGLSFDYPAGWALTDRSAAGAQHLLLSLRDSSALIQVVAYRDPLRSVEQIGAARDAVTIPYVKDLSQKLGLREAPPWNDAQCLNVGSHFASGLRLSGRLDGQPSSADVFTVVLGQRFVQLVYTRVDKDDAQGSEAWKVLLDSIAIDPPPNQTPGAERLDAFVSGGLLNGRATKKPLPDYPLAAKLVDAAGTVTVLIVVDERGEVVSARAVAGHPLLFSASESAARRAKFKPTTLCGRPVKVSGTITYNFVR